MLNPLRLAFPFFFIRLDLGEVLRLLASEGLKSHPDVRAPAFALLARAAVLGPQQVAAQLQPLLATTEEVLGTKLKPEAVKQETDRHEDMLRAALRAVVVLQRSMAAQEGQAAAAATVQVTPVFCFPKERSLTASSCMYCP